jgi:hypothetical protein
MSRAPPRYDPPTVERVGSIWRLAGLPNETAADETLMHSVSLGDLSLISQRALRYLVPLTPGTCFLIQPST